MKKISSITLGIFFLSIIFLFSCKKDEEKDTTSPVITLLGSNPATVGQGSDYTDAGATAYDETDGDITSGIITTDNVTTSDTGFYYIKYNVTDYAGNAAEEKTRTVHVIYMK